MYSYFEKLFLILWLGLPSCNGENNVIPKETVLISNETFSQTVLIDGHLYDGLVIYNCAFVNIHGDGLQIRNVDNLIIKNCTFKNIGDDAIRFRNSGTSNNVLIKDNQIYNVQGNGILAYETHSNTAIIGNVIHDVGLEGISSTMGAPQHGIYFQGKNFLISGNTIYNVMNDNGNCISVRSYGQISANKLYNGNKHGVSYYSDHPGENGTLLIQNNIIYDNGNRGINLKSNGNPSNHIKNAIIRFNTIITKSKSDVAVSPEMKDVAVEVFGNILVRTDGSSNYVESAGLIDICQNIQSGTDIGFRDFTKRNLHIAPYSLANNFANGIADFPLRDFDGDDRRAGQLDAGADQLN